MGEVYRARDQRLDRDVAIKVMAPHVATGPGNAAPFRDRSKGRRRAVASGHPLDLRAGRVDGVPVAVMELLEGESLQAATPSGSDRVARSRPHRSVCGRRPGSRACQGRGPSRSQARQRLPDFCRDSSRFSTSASRCSVSTTEYAAGRRWRDRAGRRDRDVRLHVAGAGAWASVSTAGATCLRPAACSTRC